METRGPHNGGTTLSAIMLHEPTANERAIMAAAKNNQLTLACLIGKDRSGMKELYFVDLNGRIMPNGLTVADGIEQAVQKVRQFCGDNWSVLMDPLLEQYAIFAPQGAVIENSIIMSTLRTLQAHVQN